MKKQRTTPSVAQLQIDERQFTFSTSEEAAVAKLDQSKCAEFPLNVNMAMIAPRTERWDHPLSFTFTAACLPQEAGTEALEDAYRTVMETCGHALPRWTSEIDTALVSLRDFAEPPRIRAHNPLAKGDPKLFDTPPSCVLLLDVDVKDPDTNFVADIRTTSPWKLAKGEWKTVQCGDQKSVMATSIPRNGDPDLWLSRWELQAFVLPFHWDVKDWSREGGTAVDTVKHWSYWRHAYRVDMEGFTATEFDLQLVYGWQ